MVVCCNYVLTKKKNFMSETASYLLLTNLMLANVYLLDYYLLAGCAYLQQQLSFLYRLKYGQTCKILQKNCIKDFFF